MPCRVESSLNTCLHTHWLNVRRILHDGNQRNQGASGCFISVASLWLSHLCCGSGPRWPTAISIDSVCSVAPCLSYCPSEAIIKTGRLWCVLWLFTKRLQPWWIIKTVARCAAPPYAVHCLPGPQISQKMLQRKTGCNKNPVPVCSAFFFSKCLICSLSKQSSSMFELRCVGEKCNSFKMSIYLQKKKKKS